MSDEVSELNCIIVLWFKTVVKVMLVIVTVFAFPEFCTTKIELFKLPSKFGIVKLESTVYEFDFEMITFSKALSPSKN